MSPLYQGISQGYQENPHTQSLHGPGPKASHTYLSICSCSMVGVDERLLLGLERHQP